MYIICDLCKLMSDDCLNCFKVCDRKKKRERYTYIKYVCLYFNYNVSFAKDMVFKWHGL
jgi:hypothetical protein